jgi:TRAP-type C4-dicarboxylate transport system permease small subunit
LTGNQSSGYGLIGVYEGFGIIRPEPFEGSVERFLNVVFKISKGLTSIAAVMLAFMVLLTVTDVVLRSARLPIVGTYEIVGLLGAILIGFSIPFTTWVRGHIRVDFCLLYLSEKQRKPFNIVTKCLGIALFVLIGWNLIDLGMEIAKSGEVTPTRHIPYYPVLYGIGASCFFQCIVLFSDIIKILRGEYE